MASSQQLSRRRWTDRLVVSTLLLVALVLAAYPVVATYWNNWHASRFALTQTQQRRELPHRDVSKELDRARAYNNSLVAAPRDPYAPARTDSSEWKAYRSQLGPGEVMATLRLPSIKSTMPVFHGTSDEVLGRGAGHMLGTSLPIGQVGAHAGLAAHRGLENLSGFDRLPEVHKGDMFFIDLYDQVLAYRVVDIRTVTPDTLDAIGPQKGRDLVTLVTCTPYGINSHRLLVTGQRVPWTAAQQAESQRDDGFDWRPTREMYPRLAVSGLCLVLLLAAWLWWWRDDRHRARAANRGTA